MMWQGRRLLRIIRGDAELSLRWGFDNRSSGCTSSFCRFFSQKPEREADSTQWIHTGPGKRPRPKSRRSDDERARFTPSISQPPRTGPSSGKEDNKKLIRRKKDPRTKGLWLAMLRSAGQGDIHGVKTLMKDMERVTGRPPTVDEYNQLLDAHLAIGDQVEAEILVQSMEDCGPAPNCATYVRLVALYGKRGDPSKAKAVFERMRKRGIEPTIVAYNALLSAYKPTNPLESASSSGMAKISRRDEEERGGESQEMTLSNKVLDAEALWKSIENTNTLSPCAVSYGTMIEIYLSARLFEKAARLAKVSFDQFQTEHRERKGSVPSAIYYTSILKALGYGGRKEEIPQVLEHMRENAVRPTIKTYSILLQSCEVDGDVARAESYMQRMREEDMLPNVVVYSILIGVYCRKGDLVGAVKLLDRMQEDGVIANEVCYRQLAYAYCLQGDVKSAEGMLNRMSQDGRTITIRCFDGFLHNCRNARTREEARRTATRLLSFAEMHRVKPDLAFYTALLDACGAVGELDTAQNIMKLALNGRLKIDRQFLDVIFRICKKANSLKLAESFFLTLRATSKQYYRCSCIYDHLLAIYLIRGDLKAARELVRSQWATINGEGQGQGLLGQPENYRELLRRVSAEGDFSTTKLLLDMLRTYHVRFRAQDLVSAMRALLNYYVEDECSEQDEVLRKMGLSGRDHQVNGSRIRNKVNGFDSVTSPCSGGADLLRRLKWTQLAAELQDLSRWISMEADDKSIPRCDPGDTLEAAAVVVSAYSRAGRLSEVAGVWQEVEGKILRDMSRSTPCSTSVILFYTVLVDTYWSNGNKGGARGALTSLWDTLRQLRRLKTDTGSHKVVNGHVSEAPSTRKADDLREHISGSLSSPQVKSLCCSSSAVSYTSPAENTSCLESLLGAGCLQARLFGLTSHIFGGNVDISELGSLIKECGVKLCKSCGSDSTQSNLLSDIDNRKRRSWQSQWSPSASVRT